MARPQKSRHSREALNDPQIAEKLGRLVVDIETLRTQRKQIDDQLAAAFDAVDDAGFEKKFVRKVVSLRAKETDARRDEEDGLEAYEFAIEKGVSLACARSKRDLPDHDPETGEITEQPETANEIPAGSAARGQAALSGECPEAPPMDGAQSPVTADQHAAANAEGPSGTAAPNSPSPSNAPRMAADDEAAQANPIVVGAHSNPLPSSLGDAVKAPEAGSSSPASGACFNNPRCQRPDTCSHAHDQGSCDDCFFDWAKRPLEEQRRLWAEAMEAASETEAA